MAGNGDTPTQDRTADLRVVGPTDDPDLSSEIHLARGVTSDRTLCMASLGTEAAALQDLHTVIGAQRTLPGYQLNIEDSDDVNLRVAKWASRTPELCDHCRHALYRDYTTHDCTENTAATEGTIQNEGDVVYDPMECIECGRRLVRVLEHSHFLDEATAVPIDENPF